MDTPKRINYARLKEALNTREGMPRASAGIGVVKASDLIKVGGLYRIRDNYEAVWRMESNEDGKRYIVRADTDGGAETSERLLVTSESATADSAKAAYKVVHAGAVYVAWECEACATPNLTKFGNGYECDECHKRYADVLKTEDQQRADKRTYTRAEVEETYGPEFATRMARAGITVAHRSLLEVWKREAGGADCPRCGDYVDPSFKEKHKKNCPGKKEAGAADCPKCGDYVDPSFKEKHKKNCPGVKAAAKAVNPWAVCHESVGPKKTDKFERCVKDVKKKSPIKKD